MTYYGNDEAPRPRKSAAYWALNAIWWTSCLGGSLAFAGLMMIIA